jgi:hypothetical protein
LYLFVPKKNGFNDNLFSESPEESSENVAKYKEDISAETPVHNHTDTGELS